MSNNKGQVRAVVTLTHAPGERGITINTNVSWQQALSMMIDSLAQVRLQEHQERQKAVVEPTPNETKKLVGLG